MNSLAEIDSAVERLSRELQEELLQRLTDRLGTTPEYPVRADHADLLDERFAAYRDDPSQASTWAEVKRRFEARRA